MTQSGDNEVVPNGYTVPGLDWGKYIRLRPAYPESLFTRIYDYHANHHGGWDTVHDAASGAGIAAEVLAERFLKVHVSDLSPDYLAVARSRLSKMPNANRFSFRRASAEDMSWLEPASCDALTIFCAIHWIDVDKLWPQAARSLRPGGTLALIFYNGVPTIVNNSEAQVAWERVCAGCMRAGLTRDNGALEASFAKTCTGLNSIRPADRYFDPKVTRVRINEDLKVDKRYIDDWKAEFTFPPSRIAERDDLIDVHDQDAWAREYTLDEMKQLVNTLAHRASDEELEPLYSRVEEAMRKAGQQKLKVAWSVHLLLATRLKN